MHSLRSKITFLTLCVTILAVIVVSLLSVVFIRNAEHRKSSQLLFLLCETGERNLDYYFELDKYILVHAGMNFNIDNPFEDLRSMIWVRNFKVDFNKTEGRRIIHGL